jgi:hypothetical protein
MIEMHSFKPAMHSSLSLEGRYQTQIDNRDCELQLLLNPQGYLIGTFQIGCETLEVNGGIPSLYGDVYGLMRETSQLETVAVFHALPDRNGLLLELDVPQKGDLMKLSHATRFEFRRVNAHQTQGDSPKITRS